MTETTSPISSMDEGDNLNGHVGSPNPACGGFALSLHAYLPFF